MLDNIFNSVKRGAEKVQRRGEEVAQSAKLRVEIYQLARELDGLYARLGRAYHADADQGVLDELRGDVERLNEEIASREQLILELGEAEEEQTHSEAVQAAAARTRTAEVLEIVSANPVFLTETAASDGSEPNLGDLPDLGQSAAHPVPPSDAPRPSPQPSAPVQPAANSNAPQFVERSATPSITAPSTAASRIWRAKEEARMNDDQQPTAPVKPDGPDGEAVMTDLGKELPDRKDYSGVGDEAERDKMRRHPITLTEGERAERNPDPLDK
ncbi:hypothetical protein EHF33_03670 [Deinococcus psychrotolerans]|uniref:Uncharacterized protein n=1 Tax=Deinococcus psychrotolerans TaxID=2489213 RepID=A0A3G8YKC8_9DEIO|nr:hypothetical protein [Deinococcus psychrotolerans]AZI41961.1 hypothetical protein EHF33_03670 [Deinococcus psychrotolerans]